MLLGRPGFFLLLISSLGGCYGKSPAPADYKGSQYYGKNSSYASEPYIDDNMELPKYSDDNRATLPADTQKHFISKTHEYNVAAETPSVVSSDLPPPSNIEPPTSIQSQNNVSSGDLPAPEPSKFVAPPPVKVEASKKTESSAPSSKVEKEETKNTAPIEPAPLEPTIGENLNEEVTSGSEDAPMQQETPQFLWPINGKVISAFGEEIGGAANDGINIAAQKGAPVRAAADGTVVYASEKLRDFGKMVIINHADGWISAYAHLGEMVVKKGDNIVRGQLVAFVGKTGKIDKPQLHFSLRHNKRAQDPQPLLHEN